MRERAARGSAHPRFGGAGGSHDDEHGCVHTEGPARVAPERHAHGRQPDALLLFGRHPGRHGAGVPLARHELRRERRVGRALGAAGVHAGARGPRRRLLHARLRARLLRAGPDRLRPPPRDLGARSRDADRHARLRAGARAEGPRARRDPPQVEARPARDRAGVVLPLAAPLPRDRLRQLDPEQAAEHDLAGRARLLAGGDGAAFPRRGGSPTRCKSRGSSGRRPTSRSPSKRSSPSCCSGRSGGGS